MPNSSPSQLQVLLENKTFRMEIARAGDTSLLRFVGTLNEDADLVAGFNSLERSAGNSKSLEIDLSEVMRINSCGTREWMRFYQKVRAKFAVRILCLSESFVEQVNVVPAMLGNALKDVASIMVPLVCPKCNQTRSQKVETKALVQKGSTVTIPKYSCEKCGTAYALDTDSEYFAFLMSSHY
jgi:hypothetical protein